MTQRKRKLSDTHHRTRMRVQGYEDGLKGFPPRHVDPTYMTSHRRGRERAAELREQEER